MEDEMRKLKVFQAATARGRRTYNEDTLRRFQETWLREMQTLLDRHITAAKESGQAEERKLWLANSIKARSLKTGQYDHVRVPISFFETSEKLATLRQQYKPGEAE